MTITEAIELLKANGYTVSKKRAPKANGHALGLNAIGRPYGAGYDPNYRMKYNSRSAVAAALRKPMPKYTPWKLDTPAQTHDSKLFAG